MRRWFCALQIGALSAVLWCGVASAAVTSFHPRSVNLGARLFAKLFGESTDRFASFSAVSGDSDAESPLRNLALRFNPQPNAAAELAKAPLPVLDPRLFAIANLDTSVVNLGDAAYAPPRELEKTAFSQPVAANLHPTSVEYYQSVDPIPTDAPLIRRFDLNGLRVSGAQPSEFSLAADPVAPFDVRAATVALPARLGHIRFSPHAQAGVTENPTPTFDDRSLAAGATIDVRAGHRDLGVDVSSGLENVTLAQPAYSGGTQSVALGGETLPVFVPAYADVSAHTISTGVTVPVTRSLTANLQYDTQHLLGAYGAPGQNGIDANNTIYGAQLTFKLPKSASAISLSARQYHYQDNLIPANALTQTNANLNFTVKF
ncbi:MAG TPA: hypothetical protein VIK27_05150 [Candidatus Aquilonibacter sp.]